MDNYLERFRATRLAVLTTNLCSANFSISVKINIHSSNSMLYAKNDKRIKSAKMINKRRRIAYRCVVLLVNLNRLVGFTRDETAAGLVED